MERVDIKQQGVGVVIGLVDATGRRIVTHGTTKVTGGTPVDGDTVFEIGSATKVFTAAVLEEAVRRGEVAYSDPVARHLPAEVRVPQRAGRQITLEDLVTHTSGLPRVPTNFAPGDVANPYVDYTVAQLYAFVSAYELPRDIGSRYEYSNVGVGLLGHVLARRAGVDYETLVRTRITEPLGMSSTAVTLSSSMRERLATGHNAQRQAVKSWDIPALPGAGALRSTANDMLHFLEAQLGFKKTPLTSSLEALLATRRPTGTPALDIARGWHIFYPRGIDIVWHNGGSGGYRSFMGFNAGERRAVVALSNMSTEAGVDDVGRHLLDAQFPLLK